MPFMVRFSIGLDHLPVYQLECHEAEHFADKDYVFTISNIVTTICFDTSCSLTLLASPMLHTDSVS